MPDSCQHCQVGELYVSPHSTVLFLTGCRLLHSLRFYAQVVELVLLAGPAQLHAVSIDTGAKCQGQLHMRARYFSTTAPAEDHRMYQCCPSNMDVVTCAVCESTLSDACRC